MARYAALVLLAVFALVASTGLAAVAPTSKCIFKNWKLGQSQSARVIYAGTTCTWINADDLGHCVNGLSGPTKPKGPTIFGRGRSWSYKFTKPGFYKYNCCLHANKMNGNITVVSKTKCTPKCGARCWGGDTCGGSCTVKFPKTVKGCDTCCRAGRNTPANAKGIANCKALCVKK